jgi:hypothetical protein
MLGTRPTGPRKARPDDRLRRNPPFNCNEEAGYGFASNPPYELNLAQSQRRRLICRLPPIATEFRVAAKFRDVPTGDI